MEEQFMDASICTAVWNGMLERIECFFFFLLIGDERMMEYRRL